ncbi:MAG: hypothetical protein ACK48K_19015, partial [Planctomycetota bacterium]
MITIGGIGTIIVVLLVVLVLLANVLPLFRKNRIDLASDISLTRIGGETGATFLAFGSDEYCELVWLVRPDQSLDIYCLATGELIQRSTAPSVAQGGKPLRATVARIDDQQSSVLLGLEDGSIRIVFCTIDVSFSSKSDLDRELVREIDSRDGLPVLRDQTIYRASSEGLIRKVSFAGAEYLEPIPVHSSAIENLDWVYKTDGSLMASSQKGAWASTATGELAMGQFERQSGGIGSKPKQSVQIWQSKLDAQPTIQGLMLSGLRDSLQSVDATGCVSRWSPDGSGSLKRVENYKTLTAQLSALSASEPLLGRSTLMLGNQSGELEAVALTTSESGRELRTIHKIVCSDASIRAIASSPTQRLVAVADKVGGLSVMHVTSERLIAKLES